PCIPPLFVSMTPRPPSSPLFPYTTLFRSEERKFDIIVSNPPYVSQSEYEQLPRDVRDYEPQTALLAGTTGAEIVERLIGQAAERLAPRGWLAMEISPMIAELTRQHFANQPAFDAPQFRKDLAGHVRVVYAQRRD